ncbi:Protein of unknown function [Ruminococcaceae bacterium YRB3002]|nr:Protein of unknown function [Ruminococcaceae bacterium YRB3002]
MTKLSRGGRHAVILAVATAALGILYYFVIRNTGFSLPCIFRKFTGLKCPTCGITHMFMALFKLDFKAAFNYNQLMFFLWPFVGAEILFITYRGGNGMDLPKWNYVMIYLFVGISIVFGIMRNIGVFA